jgi:hypothetical protein
MVAVRDERVTMGYATRGGTTMATLAQRVRTFLQSPRGRRLVDQGRHQLAKPENQRRLRGLLSRLQNRRR